MNLPPPAKLGIPSLCRHLLIVAPFIAVTWWLARAPKPWTTKVFDTALERKDIPLSHYIEAGVWFGVLGAMAIGLILVASARWWWPGGACPVRRALPTPIGMSARYFWFGMVIILAVALWQRWPAMGHSFWGDEGWAFCDFVHGKWKPDTAGGSPQGEIRFEKVKWRQTIFGDRSANNHWLGSILQRLCLDTWQQATGRPSWDFDERVVRVVPLAAGLGSLIALGLLGRRVGGPFLGLVAAAFLALHPLHIRFSLEARGYSLMLLFFTLSVLALLRALELGRLREWLWFGILQFLALYSWKGAIYPLAALNIVTGSWLLFSSAPRRLRRSTLVSRWFAANLIGAMLFLPLTVSSNLQVAKTIDEVRRRAKPMDLNWVRDAASETVLGMPWNQQDWGNPHEVTFEGLLHDSVWLAAVGCVLLVAMGIGWLRFLRYDPFVALVNTAIMLSGVVAALHFKYVLRVELLTWYLLFNIPFVSLLLARAVMSGPLGTTMVGRFEDGRRLIVTVTVIACFAVFTHPKTRFYQQFPREDYRGAWELTRRMHEPMGYSGRSNIHTVWLWRHTHAYDPRGNTYVRTREALDAAMRKARVENGELYLIVGARQLTELLSNDVYQAVRNPDLFDHLKTLWGVEHLNTLEVYKMRRH